MGDVLEETPSSQDDSQPINPTPEHREVTNQARIASTVQNANDHDVTNRRHPEKARDKAAQIIQDLCLRVQELEGKITNKEKHNNEHGSHATSRSRSRRGRSPTRRHDRRDGRSSSRDHRHEKSPERRYNKKHNRSASQDLSYQHYSDEDRRDRNTKRTRNDHIIMGATPFTERILRAKLPKGFDKPTDMKYDGTKDPQEHLTAFEAIMNLEGATVAVRCRAFPVTLAGPAIKWFNALPNGSIASFHDITRKTDDGSVDTIHGDREVAAECDNTSLALRKKSRDAAGVFLADLDARQDGQPRPEPEGDMEKLQIGPTKDEYTFINRNLPYDLKEELSQLLKQNRDLFAFTPADMPGIIPDLMSHRLAVDPKANPVAQRRRKMSSDRATEVKKQVKALLEANFIRELPYTTWLANVVLVKKSNGKWRIFMDAYSGYNQVPMHRPDEEKTAFITPDGTYCYTVMPFGLKNAGATYQRLVNKIFRDLSGNKLEVYIDDMLAKTESGEQLTDDLKVIMNTLRKHQMRLNPAKCAFGMEAGKFLGFMITQRGVEANLEKCRAVLEMTSPKNLKDIQKLTGRLTALSRFLGASAQKATPFFKLMKKGAPFKWETECEEAFQHFKRVLVEPPILAKPQTGETLYLYLSITEEALAAALVRENEKKEQKPVYFISKFLQDAEARYSRLEKLAFTLLTASRRLRQYFQAHPMTVRTDQAVKQVLQKPDLAGRMLVWSIELSQFQIKFEPRNAIKAQAMADFIAEMTPGKLTPESWKLHVDGSSNSTYGGAGVILENQDGITIEQSVRYEFPVSNNQAEYEALLAGLSLAREVGAKVLEVNTDSHVVSSQINGDYQTRDPLLQQYLAKVNKLKEGFEHVTIQHVPRERNARADLLSKLASTKPGHGNKSLIQEVVKTPSVSTTTNAHLTISNQGSWTYPILQYLLEGTLPPDPKEEKRIKREAANYTIVAGQLYKRGFSQPLLKCIEPENTEYILREIHEGCCGHHVGGKTLAQKVIRAGYFWPTVIRDSIQIVKNCDKCQRHANIHQAAPHQLSTISAERPFGTWGIDLVGPFPTAPGQLGYLIVAIDYYTKWIEAEPLSSITATQCRKFLWRQIITRFGIPEIVISDNGTQFTDKKFREFLEGLRVSHRFSSVEHPQTNGQVESANKIIVKGLKKRLDEAKGQ
nr:uncharacterized protein LOC112742761 [Arachis hypogaea]